MKKVIAGSLTILSVCASTLLADVSIKSNATTLKFNGTHYIGFVHKSQDGANDDDYFETRRNYFQVKAYLNGSKNYARITMDTNNEDSGEVNVRLKYAYLYLDNIFDNTGVEIGQVHRPWIDYEEHHGWLYRSVAKTFLEEHKGAHFTDSADKGINFKTKTDGFSSEIGIYNGEGYHGRDKEGKNGLSYEWRLTSHIFNTGKNHIHAKKDTYADVSFLGQYNTKTLKRDKDFIWYGVHAVYNTPKYLIAGIYTTSSDKGVENSSKTGSGYSLNGEYRVLSDWSIFARYDHFKADNNIKREEYIAGLAYDYSKNIKFIGNIFHIDPNSDKNNDSTDKFMLTAEVKW